MRAATSTPSWITLLAWAAVTPACAGDTRESEPSKDQPVPAPTAPASGRVFYVSLAGSDDNDGSLEKPWRTLQTAANSVAAGDTVYVRGGTYQEGVTIQTSGTSERRIVFSSFESEIAEVSTPSCHAFYVTSDYVTIRGFRITNGYGGRAGGNCRDWTGSGITTHGRFNIIEHNEISHSTYGVMVRSTEGDESGRVHWPSDGYDEIRDNRIHDTDLAGIRVKRQSHTLVHGNVLTRNHLVVEPEREGRLPFYTEAPIVFYCLNDLTISDNTVSDPGFGPLILSIDMVTRPPASTAPPSMAPDPEVTQCPLTTDGVTIRDNVFRKTRDDGEPLLFAFGRDIALSDTFAFEDNVVELAADPDSIVIDWGYNFWHDGDADDGMMPELTWGEFLELMSR